MHPMTHHASRITHHATKAFTLIELILVMTILTIAISVTAPALANFFRGRSLDSEARRLLALTRQGQSRAVSEGLPMELWVDAPHGQYGLEAEPSYETTDPRKEEFALHPDLQLELVNLNTTARSISDEMSNAGGAGGNATLPSNHPNLPKIRFLPDGSISESSPQLIRVTGRDGVSLFLVQSTNRLNYEIRARN
jgi:prepilin-type N-terminal cleavage/methylation domain-containing protein